MARRRGEPAAAARRALWARGHRGARRRRRRGVSGASERGAERRPLRGPARGRDAVQEPSQLGRSPSANPQGQQAVMGLFHPICADRGGPLGPRCGRAARALIPHPVERRPAPCGAPASRGEARAAAAAEGPRAALASRRRPPGQPLPLFRTRFPHSWPLLMASPRLHGDAQVPGQVPHLR